MEREVKELTMPVCVCVRGDNCKTKRAHAPGFARD